MTVAGVASPATDSVQSSPVFTGADSVAIRVACAAPTTSPAAVSARTVTPAPVEKAEALASASFVPRM